MKQKGFSLAEVIIATGISSIILLIVSGLIMQLVRLQASAESTMSFAERMIIARNVLHHMPSCTDVFSGLQVPTQGESIPLDQLKIPNSSIFSFMGVTILEKRSYPDEKIEITDIALTDLQPVGSSLAVGQEKRYRIEGVEATAYTVTKNNEVYRAWLQIGLTAPTFNQQLRKQIRKFPLHLMVDSANQQITGCFDPPLDGVACGSVGGKYCSGPGCSQSCYVGRPAWTYTLGEGLIMQDHGSWMERDHSTDWSCPEEDGKRYVMTGIHESGFIQSPSQVETFDHCVEMPEATCPSGYLTSYSAFGFTCQPLPASSTASESNLCKGQLSNTPGFDEDKRVVSASEQMPLAPSKNPGGMFCDQPGAQYKVNMDPPKVKTHLCKPCTYPAGTL